MPQYIAFLRGINLGKRRLSMSRLADLFGTMGHRSVKPFIASGNVLFESGIRDATKLEQRASAHLERELSYEVDVFIRTADEVRAISRSSLFANEDGTAVYVNFLHDALPGDVARALEQIRTPVDEFRVVGREYYWLCRTRSSESEVWKLPQMKALRLPSGTMRNMSTIRKLASAHLDQKG